MRRKLSLLVVLTILVSLLSACGQEAKDVGNAVEKPSEKNVLKVAILEPISLDNGNGHDSTCTQHRSLIFDGLIRSFDNKPVPAVAESWQVSEDGLTYTFKIRGNAKWADGKPVTAQDFEYSWKRLIDPSPDAPNGSYSWVGFYIENGEEFNEGKCDVSEVGVKAIDEKTLQVKLIRRMPYFIDMVGMSPFYPVRKDYVEKYGKDYASSPDKLIGNGPFNLVEWNHENSLIYEKNENFWDAENVGMDRLEAYVIADPQTQMHMYDSGELDVVLDFIPREAIPKYEESGELLKSVGSTGWWIAVNTITDRGEASKLLKNKNFRKALAYSIDRQALVDAARGDGSRPSARVVIPELVILDTNWGEKYPFKPYPDTIDKAKVEEYFNKALEETKLTKDSLPTLKLLTDDNEYNKIGAEILQSFFKTNLGLIVQVETQTYKGRYAAELEGNYDMALTSWAPDYNDPMTNLEIFTKKHERNIYFGGLQSDEFDRLIEIANTTNDMKERAEAMFKAEQIVLEELPVVPVYQTGFVWVKKENLIDIDNTALSSVGGDYSRAKFVK